LIDYKEPQRSEILDLLFKPSYGASFQHLKVEIGGDAQISCGAEPSPMRTSSNFSEADFGRGYEHWLMSEAKKRNPDIVLLGLVYAYPSWVSPGSSPYLNNQTESNAAEYVASWVDGVKTAHNLSMDWVGLWNEREYTKSYVKTLRRVLNEHGHQSVQIVGSDRLWEPMASDYLADPDIRQAISALTQHYPRCDARGGSPGTGKSKQCTDSNHNALKAHNEYGVQLWTSEAYSCWTDAVGAGVWANEINSNYIGGNITMDSAWHIVSAFYSSVSFWNEGMISATQPWSGNYLASPTLWASAHTTQFTRNGKSRYLRQGRGAGELSGGGTYVSFWDAEKSDLSIVVESAGPAVASFCAGNCNSAGGCLYGAASAPQNATFVLSNFKLGVTKLALWRSQLGGNVTEAHLFEQLPDVAIVGGKAAITVDPDAIYTLTTVRTASKAGGNPLVIPPSAPFPLPYSDDFESSLPPSPGRYWSDMDGGFEIAPSAVPGAKNQVLKQAVLKAACCNFIKSLDGPMPVSILGSSAWEDVQADISIFVPTGWALFGIRAKFGSGSFFSGGLGRPTGLFIAVDQHGYQLVSSIY
jgi:galactosylceramidase